MNIATNPVPSSEAYVSARLLIDGVWLENGDRKTQSLINPATEKAIGVVPHATVEDLDRALEAAKRASYGLAAYAFSNSHKTIAKLSDALEAGMVGINSFNISMPETPFGGVKASGHGSEVGIEGVEAYMVTKTVSIT